MVHRGRTWTLDNGVEIIRELSDNAGRSGLNTERRTVFTEVTDRSKTHRITVIDRHLIELSLERFRQAMLAEQWF